MEVLFACRHAADFARVLCPWLQVLEGVQGAVVKAQRVRGHGLVDGLLEGLLLELHENAVRLLPLSFSFLRRLPPANQTWPQPYLPASQAVL